MEDLVSYFAAADFLAGEILRELSTFEVRPKSRLHNHQPHFERQKKQFRRVDPLGKPLRRDAVHPRKFAPLFRSYHPIPKNR